MATALQSPLELRYHDGTLITCTLPMMGIESVRLVLGVTEDEAMALIQDGRIEWAFDLATEGVSRSFVRVWRRSLTRYVSGEKGPVPFTAVIDDVLTETSKFTGVLRAKDLQLRFNVANMHVLTLLAGGLLEMGRDKTWRRGPGGSPLITRASVIRFLERRRIC